MIDQPDVSKKQWRVSWTAWTNPWMRAISVNQVYENETEAQQKYQGLLSMRADHPPRPCDDHVWDIKLEEREIEATEWKPSP